MQTEDSGEFSLVLFLKLPQSVIHSATNISFNRSLISTMNVPVTAVDNEEGTVVNKTDTDLVFLELTFWSGCYTWKGILLLCPCPHLLYRQNETDRLTWPLQAFSPLFRILGNQQMMAMFHVVGKTKTYKDVPSHSLEPMTMWPQMTKGIWQIWLSYISGDYPE